MFGIARYVVRHKVGAVAVAALIVVIASPNEGEEVEVSSNPWAAQPHTVQVAQADDTGFMDDVWEEANGLLDEAGVNPVTQIEENGERLEGASTALSSAAN